jgi:hypothetical protein
MPPVDELVPNRSPPVPDPELVMLDPLLGVPVVASVEKPLEVVSSPEQPPRADRTATIPPASASATAGALAGDLEVSGLRRARFWAREGREGSEERRACGIGIPFAPA